MEVDGPLFEDRLLQPTDIYEEFRDNRRQIGNRGSQLDDKTFKVEQTFVQIDTDEGVSGISSAGFGGTNWHVWQLKDLLIGRDPLATEFLWDIMHRTSVHGRQGEPMMAISALDIALWDLKGKWARTTRLHAHRRPLPQVHARIRLHARTQRHRHGTRPRTCHDGQRARLHRPEMVLSDTARCQGTKD